MKLSEFLLKFNRKESEIINYSRDKALSAVETDGYSLRYVKDQTEAICLKAVETTADSLQYVDKRIFD